MKKLIACMVCFLVALAANAQQKNNVRKPNVLSRMSASLERQVKTAQRAQAAVVKIPGDKRLIKVRLEVQDVVYSDDYVLHRYWYCPAVIFNKDGALAFDGECWKAFEEAAKLRVGPVVHFLVDFGELGEYTRGEEAGNLFYFRGSYLADGSGDEETRAVDEAFRRSEDKSYIVYKLSLFNAPENEGSSDNSEVKQAISQYYQQNNLKEVNAETLSKYFKQKHPSTKEEVTRFP